MNLDTGVLDLALILLGFLVGQATKFKTPILVVMLLVKMAKWYMDTHPHGKEMAKQTNLDDKLQKLYPDAVG
jgi:hypothetical protein